MIGLGTKIFGGLSVALLISTLWYYSQYQKEVANNEILISNIQKLEITIDTQKLTIESLQKDQKGLVDSVSDLTSNNNNLHSSMTQALSEVNSLRGTLLQRSLDNPFAVSNINTDRWQSRKALIVGGLDEK